MSYKAKLQWIKDQVIKSRDALPSDTQKHRIDTDILPLIDGFDLVTELVKTIEEKTPLLSADKIASFTNEVVQFMNDLRGLKDSYSQFLKTKDAISLEALKPDLSGTRIELSQLIAKVEQATKTSKRAISRVLDSKVIEITQEKGISEASATKIAKQDEEYQLLDELYENAKIVLDNAKNAMSILDNLRMDIVQSIRVLMETSKH